MSAQDLGDIADYMLNGDNWTRINSTQVIPGQYGHPPLVPDVARDTYRPIGSDTGTCDQGNCALFAHDAYTGAYVILKVASYDQTEEDCLCALAGEFLSTDPGACQAKLQTFVDDSSNQPLYTQIPAWYLQELGILNQEFTASVLYDFWFTGCYGNIIDIPNLVSPTPSGCVQIGKDCWARLP